MKADDWAGMGYGIAYATANDAVCVIAQDVMTLNGDLTKYLGADNGNLQSDVFHRGLLTDNVPPTGPPDIRPLVRYQA